MRRRSWGGSWIGIDITHLAIGMIENRMREGYPERRVRDDRGAARPRLAPSGWPPTIRTNSSNGCAGKLGGYPRDRKKGGDKGVDGWFNYVAEGGRIETGVISVKAGDIVNPTMVRDLGRVMERDGHRFGLFVTQDDADQGDARRGRVAPDDRDRIRAAFPRCRSSRWPS